MEQTKKQKRVKPISPSFSNGDEQMLLPTAKPPILLHRPTRLFNTGSDSDSGFTFSDLTITSDRTGANRKPRGGSVSKKFAGTAASSLPVNVPDWSKILGEESPRRQTSNEEDDVAACGGETRRVPPHELLASRRMASFSVHEGAGRTLKGRDLSRVRNTIFKIRGIED